jgi:hypothetical protein
VIDAFDAGFSYPDPRPRRRYDLVSTGTCRVEIVSADYRTVPWLITDDNPRGECLSLRLRASSTHAFVFADIPADKEWLRDHVARAAGIEPARCTPDELLGRLVRVEIGHVANRRGEIRAVVRKWQPAATAPEHRHGRRDTAALTDAIRAWATGGSPERPQHKRSRNAPPRYGAADDLPF